MRDGVVVLGRALRTPLGARAEEVAARWRDGAPGTAALSVAPAPSRHARFLPRLALVALETAHEAAAAAGVAGGDRLGVFAAVGGLRVDWGELAPALAAQRHDAADAWRRGLERIHPFWVLRCLSNNAQALLATDLSARGDGVTCGGAIAGAQAIVAASRALAAGVLDAAVVMGYDSAPAEATAALVLARDGAGLARVRAACGADGETGAPRPATVAAVVARAGGDADAAVVTAGGLGAATALVQVIVAGEWLRQGAVDRSAALCLSSGAPGLAAAVRLERSA